MNDVMMHGDFGPTTSRWLIKTFSDLTTQLEAMTDIESLTVKKVISDSIVMLRLAELENDNPTVERTDLVLTSYQRESLVLLGRLTYYAENPRSIEARLFDELVGGPRSLQLNKLKAAVEGLMKMRMLLRLRWPEKFTTLSMER